MSNRILRDYTDSPAFDGISAEAERLWIRLVTKADDFGRYHADPRLVKAGCFPLLDTLRANELVRLLDELSNRSLILRYESKGRSYLAIPRFRQRLRQHVPKYPPPDGQPDDWWPTDDRQLSVNGRLEGKEKGREVEDEVEGKVTNPIDQPPAEFDDFHYALMSQEEALENLKRQFPDIDVMNEAKKLKQRCVEKGTGKPTWKALLGWLKKASPVVTLPKQDKKVTTGLTDAEKPISIEEQAEMARQLAEMKESLTRKFTVTDQELAA